MIEITNYNDIEKLENITLELKEHLISYYREITEGIAGCNWREYPLDDIGIIIIIEDGDSIDVLNKYHLISKETGLPLFEPEFVDQISESLYRIVWVTGDSFGASVYYGLGQFGKRFDNLFL